MLESLKKNWKALKRGRAGSRFQEQYDRNQKEPKSGAGRALRIAGGIILTLVGLFFLPAPGPGSIILALGALLIAREFRLAALVLDQVEFRARRVFAWGKRRWQRLTGRRSPASR
jgi:hypothetical protein